MNNIQLQAHRDVFPLQSVVSIALAQLGDVGTRIYVQQYTTFIHNWKCGHLTGILDQGKVEHSSTQF